MLWSQSALISSSTRFGQTISSVETTSEMWWKPDHWMKLCHCSPADGSNRLCAAYIGTMAPVTLRRVLNKGHWLSAYRPSTVCAQHSDEKECPSRKCGFPQHIRLK